MMIYIKAIGIMMFNLTINKIKVIIIQININSRINSNNNNTTITYSPLYITNKTKTITKADINNNSPLIMSKVSLSNSLTIRIKTQSINHQWKI